MSFTFSPQDPEFLQAFAQTRAFMLGRPARPAITPDGRAVVFLRSEARSSRHDLFEFDVVSGATRCLCSSTDLIFAQGRHELTAEERARRERQRITDTGITSFALSLDGQLVLIPLAGGLYLLERATGRTQPMLPPRHPPVMDARFTPDGGGVAFVSAYDLWLVELPDRFDAQMPAPRRLTAGGTAERFYGLPEFVAQEEMARFEGYWFAPDGSSALVAVVDERCVETFHIPDPASPESPPAAFRYPRPGRANADVGLLIVDRYAGTEAVEVVWDREAFPYLARVLWQARRLPPALWVQRRDQRQAALLTVDVTTGRTTTLFVEDDPDWINLDGSLPRWLPDGSGLIHVSEAEGAPVVQLRDPKGQLQHVIVPASAGFLSWIATDVSDRSAIVLLGDALTSRLARVTLEPEALFSPQWLSASEPGALVDRSGVSIGGSIGFTTLVETCVSDKMWPLTRVLDGQGRLRHVLPDRAENPPWNVNLQLLTVGERGLNAAVIRPRSFDAGTKYPVIVHVYGGPHALMVKADQRHFIYDQWLADHGAIVVAIDNRGTPRRGRDFERSIKCGFGTVPLEDQVAGLQALATVVPQMDLSRVGIYGWSFGGYMSALAVLRRPDVYKVAVAGAPVVDWLDYDTHYTERYLDLPNACPGAYQEGGLLTYASGLQRPLLLIHGTADDNVYLFHSLKLANALLRHGRPFDFLPLPGVTHQIGDPQVREQVWGRVAGYLFERL